MYFASDRIIPLFFNAASGIEMLAKNSPSFAICAVLRMKNLVPSQFHGRILFQSYIERWYIYAVQLFFRKKKFQQRKARGVDG